MSVPLDDDVTQNRTVPSAAPALDTSLVAAPSFVLTVVEGRDAGQAFPIDGSQSGPLLVGQSTACDIRLSDPHVSRRHASFGLADRQLRVNDMRSLNGTFVNGISVIEALLQGGELVRIGETSLRIDLTAPSTIVSISPADRFGRLVGGSLAMRRLYPLLHRLAATEIPALIEGETGTGKELLAESLHELGPRAAKPFVVFDCTTVAPGLIESELFGHERGAFTGAITARKGVFEQAHGGTLLIDEIGELPPALQPKLLRALERADVRRVGSERTVRFDVRVLCATRRDLDREVVAGRFRDDLFHRLVVARIELPPLRRRKGDVALLARAFSEQLNETTTELPEALLRAWDDYPWPGNVRELRNAVARRLALGNLTELEGSLRESSAPGPPVDAEVDGQQGVLERIVALGLPLNLARQRVLEELERRYVEKVLASHGGNVTHAAAASGIARRQFQRVKGRLRK